MLDWKLRASVVLAAGDEMPVIVPRTDSAALQIPGDCNQDGALDLSDGVCLLGHLFLGRPDSLPCDEGSVADAGNVVLLDGTGDAEVNLSDAIQFWCWRLPSFCALDICATNI